MEQNTITTTKEFFNRYSNLCVFEKGYPEYRIDEECFENALIEFAKSHVVAALKAAAKNANVKRIDYFAGTDDEQMEGISIYENDYDLPSDLAIVDKESILSAYPENLIQ